MLSPANEPTTMRLRSSREKAAVVQIGPGDLAHGLKWVRDGEAIAVRCPDYYSPQLAEKMSTKLIQHPQFGHYDKAPDIGKIGTPYFDTVDNPQHEETYWREAPAAIAVVRAAFKPYLSPIDRVRLELDEQWDKGARLLRDGQGRAAYAGLTRVFEGGAGALPHVDRLEWDAPPGRFVEPPSAQLAMNVYMKMPPGGGDLAIWRMKPDRFLHEQLRIPGSYGLARDLLPEPEVIIEPQPGELIFFDAQNVHAVYSSAGGPRVTVSFFVVLSAEGQAFIYS